MEKTTNKVIHYCWFGGAPLSDLTKKCIETWKKFLPDFEIKEWNEKNFDLEQCTFVKEAYEQKKWAFVADYTRFKVLEEYGGIYLDTDMEITADISKYLEDELFMGTEDSKLINAAVVWVKEKNNKHIKNIVDIYENIEHFNPTGDLYDMSVPRVLTTYFEGLGFDKEKYEIQKLDGATIYPMEYFYPLSYDYQHNNFTDNSCMIHHFDATWISKMEKFKTKMKRKNMTWVVHIIDFFVNSKNKIKGILNHIDISVFFVSLLFTSLISLAFTTLETVPMVPKVIWTNILVSAFVTLFLKKIRYFELNRVMDLNLKSKSIDNEDVLSNLKCEKELLKVEKAMFVIQIVLVIAFFIFPIVYIANMIDFRSLIFILLLGIICMMIYTGIKKKMKYRILDLVLFSLILVAISTFSLLGTIIAVSIFVVILVTMILTAETKKRIMAFCLSFLAFTVVSTTLVFLIQNLKNAYDATLNLNNIFDIGKNVDIDYCSDLVGKSTHFNYGKDLQEKLINNIQSSRNVLGILDNPSVLMIISLGILMILSGINKDMKNLLLGIPLLIFNIFIENTYVLNYTNFIFLFIYLNIIFIDLLKHVYKSNKIELK